jgi:hypothetical protein
MPRESMIIEPVIKISKITVEKPSMAWPKKKL